MSVPTVSGVTPSLGHSGGKTLVEIVGTNFKLPAAPPATGVAPVPPPSVRVQVDGRSATQVAVVSPTLLYCLTPKGDPKTLDTPFTATAASAVLASPGHVLPNGTSVTASSSGVLPAPLAPNTQYFVVQAHANDFGLSATLNGSPIAATDVGSGSHLATSARAIDVRVDNLDSSGNPIAGENATLVRSFTFQRPDLGEESELARVIGQFIVEMERQVLPNVHWATHTDYDATTGDQLNFAFVGKLPALIIANLDVPEDRVHAVQDRQDYDADNDRFIERRPPIAVDAIFDITGVSDNPIEILNLMQAVRMFFKKNPNLEIDRDASDPTLGAVAYEMEFTFSGPANVSRGGEDNSNIQSFAGQICIRGILLEDMPGISRSKPAGIPSKYPHEATVGYGYKTADDATAVTLQPGQPKTD